MADSVNQEVQIHEICSRVATDTAAERQRQNPELCDLCVGHFIPGTSHKTSHYGDALTQSN